MASGSKRKTGKISGVIAGGGTHVTKGAGEEDAGESGKSGELKGGSADGSKCGGVMSIGQEENRFFAVDFGKITPRNFRNKTSVTLRPKVRMQQKDTP